MDDYLVQAPTDLDETEAYGFKFAFPAGDTAVGHCLKVHGEFARIGASLALQFSKGRVFIDIGANVGAFTLPVSRRASRVIAIEAHPGLAAILERNVRENGISNVTVIGAAAGPTPGTMEFSALPLTASGNFGAAHPTAPVVEVPVVALDDLAPPDTAIVKVDVEGHEQAVIEGSHRVLSHIRPAWIVEADTDSPGARAVLAQFWAHQYKVYWLWDAFVTPHAPKKPWKDKYRGDLNFFAVPAEAPQPVGMVPVGRNTVWPRSTSGFEYLRAFGIAPVKER